MTIERSGGGGAPPSQGQSGAGLTADPVSYLAYAYGIRLELPGDRLIGVMDGHAAACRDAGLRVCQLVASTRNGAPVASLSGSFSLRAEPQWLQRFMTTVRAIHVIELRARINALRGRAALGAFAWSEANLVAGATIVRAVDIAELRTALAAVYVAAGRTAPVYTDPVISAGLPIRRAHIVQLRAAIVVVE